MTDCRRPNRVRWSVALAALLVFLALAMLVAYARTVWGLHEARLAVARGDWATAEPLIRRYLWIHPRDGDVMLLLAQVLTGMNRFSDALAQLEVIDDRHPLAATARTRAAEILLMGMRRAAQAEAMLNRAIACDPQSLDARRLLLYLCRLEDRQADARELVWQTYELADASMRHRTLATWFLIEFAQFKVQDAYPTLRQFAYNDALDVDAQVALAGLLHRESNVDTALHKLQGLNLPPTHLQGRSLLARCCFDLGDAEKGRAILDEWPQTSRDDLRYLFLRGVDFQVHQHAPDKAIDAFRQVLAVQPEDWQARHRLALCLRLVGRTQEAEREEKETARIQQVVTNEKVKELIEEVIPRLEGDAAMFYRMGQFYEELTLAREARCWYAEAVRTTSEHGPSRAALERLAAR